MYNMLDQDNRRGLTIQCRYTVFKVQFFGQRLGRSYVVLARNYISRRTTWHLIFAVESTWPIDKTHIKRSDGVI